MNIPTKPDDWNQMTIVPEMKNERMVRIGISLSDKCYEAMDFYKNKVGLFSGRTDFITSAIKYLYFDTLNKIDEYLIKTKETQTPLEKLDHLRVFVADRVDEGIGLSKTIYEGKRGQQTTIFVSERLRCCLSDLESLSGKKTGDIILAAIALFHMELVEKVAFRNAVIGALNELHVSVRDA